VTDTDRIFYTEEMYTEAETLTMTNVAGVCGLISGGVTVLALFAILLYLGAPITLPVVIGVLLYGVQYAAYGAGVCALGTYLCVSVLGLHRRF
jgi:hypothetical protein